MSIAAGLSIARLKYPVTYDRAVPQHLRGVDLPYGVGAVSPAASTCLEPAPRTLRAQRDDAARRQQRAVGEPGQADR